NPSSKQSSTATGPETSSASCPALTETLPNDLRGRQKIEDSPEEVRVIRLFSLVEHSISASGPGRGAGCRGRSDIRRSPMSRGIDRKRRPPDLSLTLRPVAGRRAQSHNASRGSGALHGSKSHRQKSDRGARPDHNRVAPAQDSLARRRPAHGSKSSLWP